MSIHSRGTPWFLMPFTLIGKLVTLTLDLTGRLVVVILGAALMLAGGLLCLTVIGAVVGIPLGVIGLMIVLRGLF
jgi:hypothetical protein